MNTRERHRLDRHKVRVEELKLWRNARESCVEEWRFAADGGEARERGRGDGWGRSRGRAKRDVRLERRRATAKAVLARRARGRRARHGAGPRAHRRGL